MAAERFNLTVQVSIDIEELINIARAAGEKILGIYEGERCVNHCIVINNRSLVGLIFRPRGS